jgi:putative membrane-bound dehydrogenase-like protein
MNRGDGSTAVELRIICRRDRKAPTLMLKAYLAVWGLLLTLTALGADIKSGGNLTPAQALASFQTEPNLTVELVAAEPMTASPCAMAWDERGRMFVAENRGYPLGGPNGKAAGTIALLEDADGDGRMDRRTEFATGLTFPNGVMPWRGGLIVTCAPEILWFKDEDGDGKADTKRVLLTGFETNKSTQLRVNDPTLGPDGWVYLAGGLSGGKITCPEHPEHPVVDLSKGDLRFRPDTGEFELADGKSQFGLAFDDFGRRFACYNRVQVQHVVLPSRYAARNPHLVSPGVMQDCPELVSNLLLRGPGASRIYPISANITTADSHAGFYSAACAIHILRGDALPAEYLGCAFTCEPTGNLVRYDRLEPSGATFAAKRGSEGIEFLASSDNWFRPVFLADGPDGALYICDMYRKTIEHPEYLPQEIRRRVDFEIGKDMGRIWRVAAAKGKPSDSIAAGGNNQILLTSAATKELIGALDLPNGWGRDTAFRLLVERHDQSAVPALKSAFAESRTAAGSVAKLRLLDILGGLDEETLVSALRSKEGGVRENAIQLAESRLAASKRLQALVINLADDPDARVRFRCALALGEAGFPKYKDDILPPLEHRNEPVLVNALVRIASRDPLDRWMRAAILSSASGNGEALLDALIRNPPNNDGGTALMSDLGKMLAANPPRLWVLDGLLSTQIGFDRKAAFIASYADGLRDRRPSELFSPLQSMSLLRSGGGDPLAGLMQQAGQFAADPQQPLDRRLQAISLLAHASKEKATSVLLPLLDSRQPVELQVSAVRSLVQPHNAGAATNLLASVRWHKYTPAVREAVLSTLLGRAQYWPDLLAAFESGALPVNTLDSARREQVKKSKDDAIRRRAENLFAPATSGDRQKAFAEAKACLTLKPAPANGREIFRRLCANCHRFEQEGYAVGPDLFGIRNQPKETILLHIVIPESEIAPNFVSYTCETKDGRTVSGIIVADTPAGVTLRQSLGQETQVARANIISLVASPLSFMPQEMEKGMTKQELADLLAFLRGEQ